MVLLKGGRGGKGNMNYATSTMQAPQYAQPGGEAKGLWSRREIKLIADVASKYANHQIAKAGIVLAEVAFTLFQNQTGAVGLSLIHI